MASDITSKLLQLDTWKKQMIVELSKYGMFLNFDAPLKSVFDVLNYCASYKFWHYENSDTVRQALPIDARNNGNFYDRGFKQKSVYELLSNYDKNSTVVQKIDNIFNWKKKVVDKLKENTSFSNFSETTSLNTIKGSLGNIMGSGVNSATNAYNIMLPKYVPNPTNSKYFSSFNVRAMNNTITAVNILGDPVANSQGNTHIYYTNPVKYSYIGGGYFGSSGDFSFVPPSEENRDGRNINTREKYDKWVSDTHMRMYPIPDFDTRITVEEGMKYQFLAVNPAYESFFKYDPSKDPWKPIIHNGNLPCVAKYTDYGYPFLYSKYGHEEYVTIIDNLPYKFKMYFVENNINRKIDGLLGSENAINADLPGYAKNDATINNFYNGHTHDTFSLFIDFNDDRKFLNPYERSLAILPLENAGDSGIEYMKRNMLNTAEKEVNSSDYDNINLYMSSYDNNYNLMQSGSGFSAYANNKYIGSYNLYNPFVRYAANDRNDYYNEAGLYGNPTPPRNYSSDSGMRTVSIDTYTYGDDAWLFKKKLENESLYYGMLSSSSISWDYYDITGPYSSYLLGIFPVNDDDTIDYSKPILYRHIIPSTAYGGVNGASDNLVSLKDVLDRDNNPPYEFIGVQNADGNTIGVEKLRYERYNIPVSAFFYRNENSPVTMYKRGENNVPVAPSFNIDKYLNKSGTTITLPKNIGRIAIKLYHSLPDMNVPRYLRRVFDYDKQSKSSSHLKRPYTYIDETIYDKGKPIKYFDNDVRNRPANLTWQNPEYNKYNHYSFTDTIRSNKNSYYYDVSESILSTKAIIIDPTKATYDNVPLLDKGLNLKVHKITKDAIYVIADTLDYDYVVDIIHKAARWWVNLPSSDGSFTTRNIFPDSIEEVSIPILNNIIIKNNEMSKYYKHNETYDRFDKERSEKFILRKALKLNINIGDVLDNTALYQESTATVKDLAHFQVSNLDYSLIYVNFSMSNAFFTNDTFLDYEKMDKEFPLKKFIKEIEGQLIFHTITPKDEDVQKTNAMSHKEFGNYVTPGTSHIIYSIGLTSNVFTKLKFKERKYNVKTTTDNTDLKDKNTVKDVRVPILNDYAISATPINYISNSPLKINIKKGTLATKNELDNISIEKFRFPFNLNEMSIDEIKELFRIPKDDENNLTGYGNYGYGDNHYESFTRYYSGKTGYDNGNINSDTQIIADKDSSYVYIFYGNFLYSILLAHYMLCPKMYNYDLKVVDGKLSLNVAIEKYEDRITRLNKEYKEQEDIRKENQIRSIGISTIGDMSWVQQERERINKGSIFDYDLGMVDTYLTYMRDIFVNFSLGDIYFQNQTSNNLYDRRSLALSSFKMLFDMNWVFTYTPGIDKEKDKVIKDIVHKTFSILTRFKDSLTRSQNQYGPGGYSGTENEKYRNQSSYINILGPIGYIWAAVNDDGSGSGIWDNKHFMLFSTIYKIINNVFDRTGHDWQKYDYYLRNINDNTNNQNYYLKDTKDSPFYIGMDENLSYMPPFYSPITGSNSSSNVSVIPYALTNNTNFTQIYTQVASYNASSNYSSYNDNAKYHNILSYYKDTQYGLLNKKKLITYRTFKKSVDKPILNPLMGRAIDFTDDLSNIPEDTKAVIYRLSLKDLYPEGHGADMRNLSEVISDKRDKFIEYARKGISVIIVVNCDDITSTNHMPQDLVSYVHEYNDEYGSGVGFDIVNDRFDITRPDIVRSLTNVFTNSNISSINEYIVDGLYIRVKNALIPFMDFFVGDFATEIKYRLYDYRKNLMKKGVIVGYNLIEFPKTIEKFKDVLINNFDDIMAEINRGTIKYYSKGDYDIPEECKDKWNKIISNIGYKIALNDIYITTNMSDYTKVYNADSGFSLNFINLSRCGILRDHKTKTEKMRYFSNIYSKLKMTLKFSSYRKRDMTHLLDFVYNNKSALVYINKNNDILDGVTKPVFTLNYASSATQINNNRGFDIVLQNNLFDFKTFNLNTSMLRVDAIFKKEKTNSYIVKKTKKVRYDWDNVERDVDYYDLENTTGTLTKNIFNLSGNSDYFVAFKLVLTPAGPFNIIPCEFKETEINFANAGYESFNGIILNDFTLDSVFTMINDCIPPETT